MAFRIKSKTVLTAKEWALQHIECHIRRRGGDTDAEEGMLKEKTADVQ